MPLPNFALRYSDGRPYSLSDYNDHVILIVNTASQCGLKSQLAELENLYQTYKDQQFIVLGFPSNQFRQEIFDNSDLKSTCLLNFGVTFPLNERIYVNGKQAAPVFQWLKHEQNGWFGEQIKWNFTKFLINRQGHVVKRYSPIFSPSKICKDIENLL